VSPEASSDVAGIVRSGGDTMDESKRRAIRFLEKEIETYKALALFLAKEDIKKHLGVRGKKDLTRPAYYRERMREARKLVRELKKTR
jgi:hypothetical protein